MKTKRYIALLRGINVGGNHKVPMSQLSEAMGQLGFSNILTLLNTGNVIFEAPEKNASEAVIERHLQDVFGFPIPVILRTFDELSELVETDPFKGIAVTKDTRLYVTFLKSKPTMQLPLPYVSADESFQIIFVSNTAVLSVLDLSIGKTVKGMDDLEKLFGKEVTTRNWNTVVKLANK
ncbi:DUF1697 domain-containing protein [Fluviicola sp. SGL-29]|nr:DUF1697 domain-containing protein [Fluviicola sp. SGL-29]